MHETTSQSFLKNEVRNIIVACNYCDKKYFCDINNHGTFNLIKHLKSCFEFLRVILNYSNKDVNKAQNV